MIIILFQLSILQELYNQQLIEAEIKHVNKLTHLVCQEVQRDKETLPVDLWKKPVSATVI